MTKNAQPAEEQAQLPELMKPGEVAAVVLISDEDCTPCKLVHDHLKKLEEQGVFPGTIQVIDPLSEEAEQYYDKEGSIALPTALIKKADGTEQACEIFINEETLALQCEGKLLIINDVPQEIRDQVEEMVDQPGNSSAAPAPASLTVAAPAPVPGSVTATSAPIRPALPDDLPTPP